MIIFLLIYDISVHKYQTGFVCWQKYHLSLIKHIWVNCL